MRRFLVAHPSEIHNVKAAHGQVSFDVTLTEAAVAIARDTSLRVEVLYDASQQARNVMLAISGINRFDQGRIPLGRGLRQTATFAHGLAVDVDRYYNVTEIASACQNLAALYSNRRGKPDLAQLIALPYSTREGRASHALRIGSDVAQAGRPVLMLIGGLHGGELGSAEILINLAADLLGSHDQGVNLLYGLAAPFGAQQVAGLLAAVDLVVFPFVNLDGRDYSQRNLVDWRKNCWIPPSATLAPGAHPDSLIVGVDLNRNFDFLFDIDTAFVPNPGIQASKVPAHSTYQGCCVFSEPETRNVRWLLEQHPSTRWFADLHAGAQDVVLPWSDDQVQSEIEDMNFLESDYDHERGLPSADPWDRLEYREYQDAGDRNAMTALAQAFTAAAHTVSNTPYGITGGFEFAAACGTSHDWVYSRHLRLPPAHPKTLALAIEWFGDGPSPDMFSGMLPIIDDVTAGLIAMGLTAAAQP